MKVAQVARSSTAATRGLRLTWGSATRSTTGARTFCTRPARPLTTSTSKSLFQLTGHRAQQHALRRLLSTSGEAAAPRASRRPRKLALLGLTLVGFGLGGSLYILQSPVRLDSAVGALVNETSPRGREKKQPSLVTLARSYLVYTLCSIPALVDASPTLLKYAFAIPGVSWVAEKVVRATFFAQVSPSFLLSFLSLPSFLCVI